MELISTLKKDKTTEWIQQFRKIIFFKESVILFLAAGDNSGEDPLDVIKDENEARNNSVTILTYSFGIGKYMIWSLYSLLAEDLDISLTSIHF